MRPILAAARRAWPFTQVLLTIVMSHWICLHLFLVGFSIHRSSHSRVFSLLATASRTAHMTHVVVSSYMRDNMRRRSWGSCTHYSCSRLCLCELTSVIRVDLGPTPSASELNENCLSIVYLGAVVNLIQTAISNTSESSYEPKFRVLCGLLRAVYKSYHRPRMRIILRSKPWKIVP